jgi:uncharacterized protein involved in type VI secretion and phage assembly
MSLLDTLNEDDQENRVKPINGVVTGLVTNNKDPNGLGRVKVKLNGLEDNHETDWAPVATLMAGNQRGSFFLPEVNDEVLVAFEHGNIDAPYVVGALWNGRAKPPVNNSDGKNNIRKIKSRSGHEIILDDTDQKEKVEIKTNAGHSITLDDASGSEKVEMQSKGGHKFKLDDSVGTVTIEDKIGNKITMGPPGVDINGKLTVSK